MVTVAPTAPVAGDKLEMLGAGVTVNVMPLLACPPTVTMTEPVVAVVGTVAVIVVLLQLLTVADWPLNLTVLPPWTERKLFPAMVITDPTAPELGARLLSVGYGVAKGTVI